MFITIALNPECRHLGPIRSLESLPFEDYISVIECQPDLIGGNDEREQGIKVRSQFGVIENALVSVMPFNYSSFASSKA